MPTGGSLLIIDGLVRNTRVAEYLDPFFMDIWLVARDAPSMPVYDQRLEYDRFRGLGLWPLVRHSCEVRIDFPFVSRVSLVPLCGRPADFH
jgi:hypothetical protein